jgi:hypothetical protein
MSPYLTSFKPWLLRVYPMSSYFLPSHTLPFPSHLSLIDDLLAPSRPTFARMLGNVALGLLLELNFVQVVVKRNYGVDGVAKLRNEQQGIDGIDQALDRGVYDPIMIEDRMADATMAVDVCMVDRGDETYLRW